MSVRVFRVQEEEMKELWGGGFVSFHPVSCLITHQMCVWWHSVITAFVWKWHGRNEQSLREMHARNAWIMRGILITFNILTLQNCTPRSKIPCVDLTPTVSILPAGHRANPALGILLCVLGFVCFIDVNVHCFGSIWQHYSSWCQWSTMESKCFDLDWNELSGRSDFCGFVLIHSLKFLFVVLFWRSGGRLYLPFSR